MTSEFVIEHSVWAEPFPKQQAAGSSPARGTKSAGQRLRRRCLARAQIGAVIPHSLAAAGALLSSDDCGSSVERTAKVHPLWQVRRQSPAVAGEHSTASSERSQMESSCGVGGG
jgi:hypothetical protein